MQTDGATGITKTSEKLDILAAACETTKGIKTVDKASLATTFPKASKIVGANDKATSTKTTEQKSEGKEDSTDAKSSKSLDTTDKPTGSPLETKKTRAEAPSPTLSEPKSQKRYRHVPKRKASVLNLF